MSQEEMIRENAGDAMNQNIQSPEGTKDVAPPDSNTSGVSDPQPPEQTAQVGSVEQETAALSAEAQEAQEYFAGVKDQPGFAGIVESKADGVQGGPSAGQTAETTGYDPGAPERAREQQSEAEGGDGSKEPATGDMYAGVISSDPNMQWESKMAEKLSGAEGVTAPEEGS